MGQTNNNILADSVAGIPHIAAFDDTANARLSTIELENLLVYVIDTVPASALPYLARQFDIEGFSGYRLATTDEQKRAVIKTAIELKRYAGTVWAIKQAMLSVGYTDAVITEGIDTGDPDTDWARFRIDSVLGDTVGIDGISQSNLAKLVREYKPARSKLEGIGYSIAIYDEFGTRVSDVLQITYEAPSLDEDLGYFGRFADGAHLADGSINAIESLDSLVFNIVNV